MQRTHKYPLAHSTTCRFDLKRRKRINRRLSNTIYTLLALLSLVVFIKDATAQIPPEQTGPHWSLIDVQYLHPDFDDSYLSGRGIMGKGFAQFGEFGLLFGSGSAANVRDTFFNRRFETTTSVYNLGIGGRYPINEVTDIFAVAGPSVSHIDFGGGDTRTDGGFFATGGVRALLAERFDVAVAIDYANFDGYDDTSVSFEARYWFNRRFALSTGFSPDSDVNVFSIGFSVAL